MRQQLAKDGLEIVTVALDSLDGEADPPQEVKDRLETFLKKNGAGLTNLLLDEKAEFWQEKLRFIGPPQVYVFDRRGKWTQFDAADISKTPDPVEGLIRELLKEK
jgi:hypothetical protein